MNKEDLIVLKDYIVKTIRKRNLLNKDYLRSKSNKILKKIERFDKEIGKITFMYGVNANQPLPEINRKFLVPNNARQYQVSKGNKYLQSMLGLF